MRPLATLRFLALCTLLAIPAGMARADDPPKGPDIDRMLRELMDELSPTLDQAMRLFRGLEQIDDPMNYDLPEVLPNGDIIIRRRLDAPPFRAPDPDDEPLDIRPEGDGSIRT